MASGLCTWVMARVVKFLVLHPGREAETTGRRKRGQPGSHAKLLPGSKALLDSEKQFGLHLSIDP